MPAKDSTTKECFHKFQMFHQEIRVVILEEQEKATVQTCQLVCFIILIYTFIDDVMFIEKSKKYSLAFENQFHYGVFYAYLKLREMEIKNIVWLAELVSIGVPRQMPGWSKFVVPFKYHKEEV